MSLTSTTKTALNESRTLMLGAQILLGFQLQAPFQNQFGSLSSHEKAAETAVLCLMVLVLGLLIAPSAYHRIVDRGNATFAVSLLITRMFQVMLLPFGIALGLAVGAAFVRIGGSAMGVFTGIGAGLIALGCWYGPLVAGARCEETAMIDPPETTSTATKIEYVLTEARVVLPGAQALLGFQLAIVFTGAFAELSDDAKGMHGVALACIAFATVLLLAPAAYHRIVYRGANAPQFHRTAGRLLLSATMFLAMGLSADVRVVIAKITDSVVLGNSIAALSATILLSFWVAWPWWRRVRRENEANSDRLDL